MNITDLLAIDEERTMKPHKLPVLKPTLPLLDVRIGRPMPRTKTLKQRQQETGRTLALNGVAWRKLRALVLSEQPFCSRCERVGRMTPATDVDHVDGDPTNNTRANLMGLCHECHSQKTQADMGKRVAYGCDDRGMPLDPDHPWNQKSPATDGHEPPGNSHARDGG